jgi:FlaA1/EpsC-like NDP-sugar epimerase
MSLKKIKSCDKNIRKMFDGKKILITGGTGSIGSEIVRQLITRTFPKQVRIFSRDESKHFLLQKEVENFNKSKIDVRFLLGDIRDKDRLSKAFRDVNIVFHAAALKHVPFCEYNPFEAVKTNVYGTQNVIDLAIEHNVEKVIAISTDKAVYPNTILGITKLLMERMVISSSHYIGPAKTKFAVVRFGNVLNSRCSVIPTWIEQINNGSPVTVTNKKMKRFIMSIPDAVNLVFLATTKMIGQEIFVLKMEEKNIYELAKETIKEYANGKKIEIKITGAREREKTIEKLCTDEEKQTMIDCGSFWVILPNEEIYKKRINNYKK